MFCAVWDYVCFRRRAGRYHPRAMYGIYALASRNKLPEFAASGLSGGDAVFMGAFQGWRAWAVMYVAGAPISHVASCLGSGQIIHATTAGVTIDSITSLYEIGRASCRERLKNACVVRGLNTS